MKISKKVLTLIITIIFLSFALKYMIDTDQKYVLSNVTLPEINYIETYHENNIITYNIEDTNYTAILELLKNSIKNCEFISSSKYCFYTDNFAEDLAIDNSDDYFLKVNFNSDTKLKLDNTSILCKYIIINLSNNTLFYWSQTNSSIYKMSINNSNFYKLEKYIKNI